MSPGVRLDLDRDWSVGARGVGRRRVPYSRGWTAAQPGQAGGPRGVIRCSFVLQGLGAPDCSGPVVGVVAAASPAWVRGVALHLAACAPISKSRPVRAVAARARVNSARCSARPPSHPRKTAPARLLRTGAVGGTVKPGEGALRPSAGRAGVAVETLYPLRRPVRVPVRSVRVLGPAGTRTRWLCDG